MECYVEILRPSLSDGLRKTIFHLREIEQMLFPHAGVIVFGFCLYWIESI
jgi:hypothetical protein